MADSSKPSWRRGSSEAGRGNAASGKGWQSRRQKASQSAVSSHRAKLIGLGVLVLGLAGYFASKVFFLPVKTPLVILSANGYSAPLPPNGYSQEDTALLAQTNPENIQATDESAAKLTRDELVRHLEQLPKQGGGPNRNAMLLYISAHGALNDSGAPCLLLSDSSPTDSSKWLPFTEIIDQVKSRPNLSFVLLLDAGRIDEDWRLGILHNGFVEQLEELLTAAPVANLHVVNSTSAGERGWTAPEIGGSVFGYFAAQGLSTADSNNDKTITLRELTSYLTDRVSGWVSQNRSRTQTPKLLTSLSADKDVAIAYRGGSTTASAPAATADRQRIAADWKAVNQLWVEFEGTLHDRRLLRYEPLATAQLQRLLLRMEQLILAGAAYRKEFDSAQTEFRTLLLESDPSKRLPSGLQAFSFSLQQQLASSAANASDRQLVLKKWIDAKGKPMLKEGEPPLPQLSAGDAQQVAWQFVRQLPLPSRAQVRDAISLLDESSRTATGPGLVANVSEVLFLRMVNQYVDHPNESADFSSATQRYLQRLFAVRERAEEVAAPDDGRAHHWLQPLIDSADISRRLAEDALFCDGVAAADESELNKIFANRFQFAAQYDAAAQRRDAISDAYALRDEVWAGLPYLASWLLRAGDRNRASMIGADGSLVAAAEFIEQLAVKNHELAAAIDEALTADQLDSPAVSTTAKELTAIWTKLRDAFVAHAQALKDRAGQNNQTLLEIAEVLRVPAPWLEAQERNRLAIKFQDILFAESERDGGASKSASPTSPESHVATVSLKRHPALGILARNKLPLLLNLRTPETDTASENDKPAMQFAREGARVRKWLTDLSQAARDLEDVSNRRLEEATETAANQRAGVSETDRLVRAAACLATAEFPDPAQRLRRVDLHLEFLWHARRALDDFWGPVPGGSGGESYFATAAEAYLAGARRLENKPKSLVHKRADLSQLLADRKAAVVGTRIEPKDVTTLGGPEPVEQQVRVEWHTGLPTSGVAALYLEETLANSQPGLIPVTDRDSRGWRRELLPWGNSPVSDVVHFVPAQKLTAERTDRELTANLLFRGHLLRSKFSIRGSTPLLVSVNPQLPRHAKITVKGEGDRRAFIVFIFDCSRSMEQDSRIVKAKEAFRQVLDSLPKDEHYNVGLRAYGRRAGYNSDATEIYGPDGQAVNIDPNTDVELMVEVAPMDDDQHNAITKRFRELQPLGVTPLYLAIQSALQSDDFVLARREDLKQIIVITDGINEQIKNQTTREDVLRTIRQNPKADGVRVDVVLFQEEALRRDQRLLMRLASRSTSLAKELEDVKAVARAAGGEYFSAERPEQLVAALRNILKLVKYSVAPVGGAPVTEKQQLDLGKEWVLTNVPPTPQQFAVRLHGVSNSAEQIVTVEGGEALELRYDRSQDRLVFPRYVRGDARAPIDGLVDPRTKEQYQLLPILPRRIEQNAVEFQVAIQNNDQLKFTPRPPHVWAEIQPLNESGQGADFTAYRFVDAEFVPDTPVPVFRFLVPNWPSDAKKVGLQMWTKFDTPPLEINGSALVEELKSVVIQEDIPDVSFNARIEQIGERGRGWRVTVWEEHIKGTDLFTARVQTKPAPAQLRHQFFVGVDRVKHEFDYVEKPGPAVMVTSKERIQQSAVTLPRVVMEVE